MEATEALPVCPVRVGIPPIVDLDHLASPNQDRPGYPLLPEKIPEAAEPVPVLGRPFDAQDPTPVFLEAWDIIQ